MKPHRAAVLSCALWVFWVVITAHATLTAIRATHVPIVGNDFPAFYCAGRALDAGADPYRLEPLRSCENSIPHGSDLPAGYVTPAPLPGWSLGLFRVIAHLPYAQAAWIWFAVILGACVASSVLISRSSGIPSGVVATGMLTAGILTSAPAGQLPLVAVLGIVLCGVGLVKNRPFLATAGALLSSIEPHLAIGAWLGLAVVSRPMRWYLAAAAAALGAVSIVAAGWPANVEYVHSVLPIHAAAELWSGDQYSLAHVLALLGLNPSGALSISAIAWIAVLGLSLLAARRFANATRRDEAWVFVPVALSLLAGTFLHQIQLVAAMPAAMLLAGRLNGAAAWVGRLTVIALAAVTFSVVVEHHAETTILAFLCATIAGGFAIRPAQWQPKLLAISVLAALVAIAPAARAHEPVQSAPVPANTTFAPTLDASVVWGVYLRNDPQYADIVPAQEEAKWPIRVALLLMLAAALPAMARLPRTRWVAGPTIRLLP